MRAMQQPQWRGWCAPTPSLTGWLTSNPGVLAGKNSRCAILEFSANRVGRVGHRAHPVALSWPGPVMSRMFTAHGDYAEILEGGSVVKGYSSLRSWARAGTGFRDGTHTWRLRVRACS